MEEILLTSVLATSSWSRMGLSMMFFWITFAALAMLSISLFFGGGEELDHDADIDADHDLDHDADTDHDGGSGNMGFLSFRVLLMFVAGFGCGGFFAARANYALAGSSAFGVLGGFVLAAVGYSFLNLLYRSQSSSVVRTRDVIGTDGVVMTSILPGQIGRISCWVGDRQEEFSARTTYSETLPVAAQVKIVNSIGSILIVEPVNRNRIEEKGGANESI